MEDAVYAIDPALSLRVYITQNLHEKVLKVQDSSRRFQSMLKKVNFTANYVSLQKWAFDVNEELAVQFIHSLTEKEDVLIESLDEIVNFFLEHGLTDRCKKLLEIASKFTYNRYILENIAAMQETVYSPLRVTNTTIFETFQTFTDVQQPHRYCISRQVLQLYLTSQVLGCSKGNHSTFKIQASQLQKIVTR